MREILIIGAGGHGQVVADLLHALADRNTTILGFLDDDPALAGQAIMRWKVLGATERVAEYPDADLALAIGDNRLRRRTGRALIAKGRALPPLVHPAATVAEGVRLGPGVTIAAGAVVGTGSEIGAGAILNTGCTVDHHNEIGAWAHIAPGVNLGGTVRVGEGALVGIGAAVLPNTSIGDWAVVAAGGVVDRSVPPEVTVMGVPARVCRRTESETVDG